MGFEEMSNLAKSVGPLTSPATIAGGTLFKYLLSGTLNNTYTKYII